MFAALAALASAAPAMAMNPQGADVRNEAPSPAAAPPSAVDEPEEDAFIINAWSNPDTCHQQVAQPVPFARALQDAEQMLGQCVIIEGYWHERALFDTARHARSRRSMSSSKLAHHRIGLYADWDNIRDMPTVPTRTRFVGRLDLCETRWPDGIMVMGYCHYTGGPILLVSQRISD